MSYYIPKYFGIKEMVSSAFYHREKLKGDVMWRVLDERILITVDRIRVYFCGPKKRGAADSMTVNNWAWGGNFHARGFRHPVIDILKSKIPGNDKMTITGQHCFGRGIDYNFRKTAVEEVLEDIQNNPNAERYEFITGIELGVTWCHNDIRNWDKGSSGLFIFNRGK